jgi:hypothetical protein
MRTSFHASAGAKLVDACRDRILAAMGVGGDARQFFLGRSVDHAEIVGPFGIL